MGASTPNVYLDTSAWMAYSEAIVRLHENGKIRLRISNQVVEELRRNARKTDEMKVGLANRALDKIRELQLEGIYRPEASYGGGRYGEIRYGDPGPLTGEGFEPDDREVARYAIAGHIDFAKRGRVDYFVTEDKGILKRRESIKAEAPGIAVLKIAEFLAAA